MTHTIPPTSPKAAQAAAFGRELVKACQVRDIPLKELERTCGVGHTTLDNYRRGLILPKTETAIVLAETLDWPPLRHLILKFRTYPCARPGCGHTFRNDGGSRKAYCSETCRRIAESLRMAERRARQAGQTEINRGRHRANQLQRLRAALKIADERNVLLSEAIEAMCRDCEPEGICRTEGCALRPFSPLPASVHEIGSARTEGRIRSEAWTPERHRRFGAALARRWSDPAEHERQAARSRAFHATLAPGEWAERIRQAKRAKRASVPAQEAVTS